VDFPFLSVFTFLRHPAVQALDSADELLDSYLQPFSQYASLHDLGSLFTIMPSLHALNETLGATALPHVEQGTPMYDSIVHDLSRSLSESN